MIFVKTILRLNYQLAQQKSRSRELIVKFSQRNITCPTAALKIHRKVFVKSVFRIVQRVAMTPL